ncbi:MAG: efflux RND transporter periplasmic adaptor subunit [Candidatus Palauibacterales bacterium]|nr:efflux RND transporter periplasmic adaptor subunit [Candidatus Palauibacterales bacterium]MDP2482357.1 efflux RND transporter periplasmic adaptor subunit [Candidatus Palauibacterales bacterium]
MSDNGRRLAAFRPHVLNVLLFTTVSIAAGCGGDEPVLQPPEVTVSRPLVRAVRPFVDFTGTTRAVESVEIRARVGGVLEQQIFTPADIVDEGQVLFVIEPEQYQAARDEALAALRSAVADSALKESNLERVQIAIETNAVSRQDLDRAQAERDAAVAAVLGARARLVRAQLDYDYTRVRSPIEGQVGRRLVDPGNLVGYRDQTLLTTVNRLRPIHVYFSAPEWVVLALIRRMEEEGVSRDLDDSTASAREPTVSVLVGTSADGDTFPFVGRIDFIGNTVDPATGTIELRAVFQNDDLQLFPGLFVRVRLLSIKAEDALLVREAAIGSDLGGKYVFVLGEGNIVDRRYVELGQPQPDGTVVVESGLEADETYVSNGLLRARPGMPVTPRTEEEMAASQAAVSARFMADSSAAAPGEEE